jgi:hypothetical protein
VTKHREAVAEERAGSVGVPVDECGVTEIAQAACVKALVTDFLVRP